MKRSLLFLVTICLMAVSLAPIPPQTDRGASIWRMPDGVFPIAYTADMAGAANLAAGKPAQQSSTDYGGDARRALDGNTDGVYYSNSVSHTGHQAQPWWQVDLGSVQGISNIRLWNRTDCCGERLSKFYVFVSDSPFVSGELKATLSQPGVWNFYLDGIAGRSTDVGVNRSGRYVRVQLAGSNYLHLAEVEVFGGGGGSPHKH